MPATATLAQEYWTEDIGAAAFLTLTGHTATIRRNPRRDRMVFVFAPEAAADVQKYHHGATVPAMQSSRWTFKALRAQMLNTRDSSM